MLKRTAAKTVGRSAVRNWGRGSRGAVVAYGEGRPPEKKCDFSYKMVDFSHIR